MQQALSVHEVQVRTAADVTPALEEERRLLVAAQAQLAQDQASLKRERALLQKEKERMTQEDNAGEVIKVNVGGTLFTTRKSTLCRVPCSFLESMFSGRHRVSTDDSGAVFIDRNPKHFTTILDWLRDPATPTALPLEDPSFVHELEYYGLAEEVIGPRFPNCIYVCGGWDGHRVRQRSAYQPLT